MLLGIALLVGVGGMIVMFAIVLPRIRRPVCPVCMRRAARLVDRVRGHERDSDRTVYWQSSYECLACKSALVQRDGGPLITRAAFDAGMRDVLPAATVVAR